MYDRVVWEYLEHLIASTIESETSLMEFLINQRLLDVAISQWNILQNLDLIFEFLGLNVEFFYLIMT